MSRNKNLEEKARYIFENTSVPVPDDTKPEKVCEIAAMTLEATGPAIDILANKIPMQRHNVWRDTFLRLVIADGLRKEPMRRFRDWPHPTNIYDVALVFLYDTAVLASQIPTILQMNNMPPDTFSNDEMKRFQKVSEVSGAVAELLQQRPLDEVPFSFKSFENSIK